jgi:hypothetical protein
MTEIIQGEIYEHDELGFEIVDWEVYGEIDSLGSTPYLGDVRASNYPDALANAQEVYGFELVGRVTIKNKG